ncbi:MAG: cytochrome c, partial [Blastocatellia bacterium]|nr:cytochrome c [Blastocatellia bacterium]
SMNYGKLLVALSIALFGFACGSGAGTNTATNQQNVPAGTATPAPTPEDTLAIGRKLFKQNCATCHKEDGTGGKITIEGKTINPDDLTSDKIKKFDDDKITGYIFNGVEDEGMPAFKGKLSEAQIREIVRFVRVDLQKMPEPTAKQSPR